MKNLTKISLSLLVIFTALLVMSAAVLGSANQYELIWWTVDGGGGVSQSAGGEFSMTCTIGQPDAGETMSGGNFDMGGGFFGDIVPEFSPYPIYVPLVVTD